MSYRGFCIKYCYTWKINMGIPNNEESRKHEPQTKYLTNLGSLTYSYKSSSALYSVQKQLC